MGVGGAGGVPPKGGGGGAGLNRVDGVTDWVEWKGWVRTGWERREGGQEECTSQVPAPQQGDL